MDFLASLPKIFADVAAALIRQKAENKVRLRLGALLLQVAECVNAIGEAIRSGVDATERCSELDMYIAHIEELVAKECSDETAKQVVFWLTHVAEVPGIARIDVGSMLYHQTKPKWLAFRRDAQAKDVLRIAGYITAIGHLVQA